MQKRLQFLSLCEHDPEYRAKAYLLAKRDFAFFFNYFLWTYDPRTKSKIVPFRLWEFQRSLVDDMNQAYLRKHPLLVEKSRDMGFSWCFLGWIVWRCLYEHGFSAGIGSRKFSLVDTIGDMDSLIEKVRFLMERLPPWLLDFDRNKHSKAGQINLPETGASISGEGGDNIGRGGRSSIYFIDEFAHIPRSSIVQEAVFMNSDCIIYGSTPNGKGNEFARLRWDSDIKIVSMHWKDHPNKNQEWYDGLHKILTVEQIAQEVDISYAKSTKGRVHKWFDADIHAKEIIDYDPNHPIYITLDFGIGDPTSVVFLQDFGSKIRVIEHFEEADKAFPWIYQKILETLKAMGASTLNVEGWYGDPDGKNRERLSGESIASWIWDNYRIKLRFKLPNVIKNRLTSVRLLGEANRINISKRLRLFVDTTENYKFPDKEHGENEKPLHNWCSHAQSALEYYCVYEHGMSENKKEQQIQSQRFR